MLHEKAPAEVWSAGASEDYGHQPVGKSKQAGFTFGDPKQNGLFDADRVSEYVQDKENWNDVSENNPSTAPLQQLPLAFDQPAAAATPRNVPDAKRVRMESTGRLDHTASKIRNPADAARLLIQHSTAAQENLFTIAVDKNDNIVEVHRYRLF